MNIFKAGRQDPELNAILRANCRLPDCAMGDFPAQIAAIRTGERRVSQLLQRYGTQAFTESIQLIFAQSERLARAVRTIPDGVYEAESFMDDDGVVRGKHIPVRVRVEVRGTAITCDLSGVGAQVAGYFKGQVLSSKGRYAIRFTISSGSSTVQTTSRSNTYFLIVDASWHLPLGEG